MNVVHFFGFYLRRAWRAQPLATTALLGGAGLVIASLLLLSYWQSQRTLVSAELDSAHAALLRRPDTPVRAVSAAMPLPEFSSAEFTSRFLAVASDSHVPADELSYVLETGTAQPYWRYRVSFDLKAGYPQLRQFIAMLAKELPHVALDTVRCRREDEASANLTCQLTFSAFFRKDMHG